MKTMSDFIMEQEISLNEVDDDVEIMESFMQMTAIGAVAECYCEHAAIAEFAAAEDIEVFSESVGDIAKKAIGSTKKFFATMWRWIKAIAQSILNFFTKSKIDKVIAKIWNEDMKGTVDINSKWLNVDEVLTFVSEFKDVVADAESGATVSKSVNDLKTKIASWDKEQSKAKGTTVSATLQECAEELDKINKSGIPDKGRKILKALDFDKKKVKNGAGEEAKYDKETVKAIKELSNDIAKVYDKYSSATIKLVEKVLNEKIKADKAKARTDERNQTLSDIEDANYNMKTSTDERKAAKEKFGKPGNKNESYEEDTDGYFFL